MATRKFILFELNEVPFSVIDYYTRKYPTSFLAKTLPKCAQIETVTEDEGELSPWITWPTFHRGVTNVKHKIKDFGENLEKVDKAYPTIWKILSDNQLQPGVFASMHTFPMPENYTDYSFFIPDPFASDSKLHPAKLEPFQKFNLAMSRKSGRNVDSGIDLKSASELAINLPSMGIKVKTLVDVAGQIVSERLDGWKKNRRRVFQPVLAFDIFSKLIRTKKPTFATFFSNHVASTMHRYWAATFPNDYKEYNLSDDWKNKFSGEIDFAFSKFEDFFENLVKFADQNPEYKIVVASSMGQEATKAEKLSTELYCKNMDKFTSFLGLQKNDWEQKIAMHPQYNLTVTYDKIDLFAKALKEIFINGKPLVFRKKEGGFFSINLGHRNLEEDQISFKGVTVKLSELGLVNEQIDDESDGTAYHIPEGSMIIYDPQDTSVKNSRISGVKTTSFVPTILENFKIPVPDYMEESRIKELLK
ncbi:hypothetical protein [Flexithrix dorotheae]|uniref:hypothetical protein n=1 Tax=Flexithrix dorotheae TaxID=70993 RepID=UPI0003A39400|nr:hypothetical protein [Flexithrix dorotheae]